VTDQPWTPGNAYAAVLGNVVALALALVAWVGASGKLLVSEQTGWAALGVGAAIVAGAVNTVWLLAGRRALALRRTAALDVALPAAVAAAGPPPRSDGELPVAGAGMTAFHRPDCWLATGRAVEGATADGHRRAGLRACEVCGP
jgi:hypothetical protein